MVGPMVGASVATSPISGVIRPMRERGKIMNEVAKTVGIMAPPMNPWMSRHAIISLIEVDSPHIRLAAVNPAARVEKRIQAPIAAVRKARGGVLITSALRYAGATPGVSFVL